METLQLLRVRSEGHVELLAVELLQKRGDSFEHVLHQLHNITPDSFLITLTMSFFTQQLPPTLQSHFATVMYFLSFFIVYVFGTHFVETVVSQVHVMFGNIGSGG